MLASKPSLRRPRRLHRMTRKVRQPRLLMAPPSPDPRLPVKPIDPNARFPG
jgi:hypothetical protein